MFDYSATMQQVREIQSQADMVRTQSNSTEYLASIVGSSYQGEDAEKFQYVIDSTSSDLVALAKKLDSLASSMESAARIAQQKMDALEGEYSELTYYNG